MHYMFVNDLRQYIFQCFAVALYEKEHSVMTDDAEFAKLHAQVEILELASAQKDTCIAEYEAKVKGSEGEDI